MINRLSNAEREIARSYGHDVSFTKKAKSLRKFGRNSDVDTGSSELVWENGGLEVYPTTNSIDTVSSSDAGDTEAIMLEGHTIDANGDFTFVVQSATLNGQTKVVLTTPMARANRMYNNSGTNFLGVVYCYEDSAITAGVPNDLTTVHVSASSGTEQSLKAASTISKDDYYVVTSLILSVRRSVTATVDFELQIREKGKVFRTIFPATVSSSGGSEQYDLDPVIIVKPNADFRVLCNTSTNNTIASAVINGYLGIIQ